MPTQLDIPGYVAGTWTIDKNRSTVAFEVRVLGLITTRGTFGDFTGTITTADDPFGSSVNAVIQATSVNTKNKRRDRDLQKKGYLSTAAFPTITFNSTGVRSEGGQLFLDGDLVIRGNSKPVTLALEPGGFGTPDTPVAQFTAHTEISGSAFGVINGGMKLTLNDTVKIKLEINAARRS